MRPEIGGKSDPIYRQFQDVSCQFLKKYDSFDLHCTETCEPTEINLQKSWQNSNQYLWTKTLPKRLFSESWLHLFGNVLVQRYWWEFCQDSWKKLQFLSILR